MIECKTVKHRTSERRRGILLWDIFFEETKDTINSVSGTTGTVTKGRDNVHRESKYKKVAGIFNRTHLTKEDQEMVFEDQFIRL